MDPFKFRKICKYLFISNLILRVLLECYLQGRRNEKYREKVNMFLVKTLCIEMHRPIPVSPRRTRSPTIPISFILFDKTQVF